MNRRSRTFAVIAAAVLFAGVSSAGPKAHPSYLKPGAVDILSILPPAPVPGDPRYDSDRAMFKMTRKLEGTPRWSLAINDVEWNKAQMLKDFSCAIGVMIPPEKAPKLSALLDRAGNDTQRETNVAKDFYKRQRPFHIDQGPICQKPEDLGDSYDYPSGHTTGGWTWALVLSDVFPNRASAIMARGRAYGESRIVCGAHNASAVESGRLSATITMAAVRNTKAYKRDVAAAQAELRALRASRKVMMPTGCEAEKSLISQSIYVPVP